MSFGYGLWSYGLLWVIGLQNGLWIAGYGLLACKMGYGSRVMGYWLANGLCIAGYGLCLTGSGLCVMGCWLAKWVMDRGLWVIG